MTDNQAPAGSAQAIFAVLKPGMSVAYPVMVNGKEILTRGEVFGVRRVGHNRAEITLLHTKTNALFTNVFKGNDPVFLFSPAFAPLAIFGKATTDIFMLALRDQVQKILSDNAQSFYELPIAE